MKERKPVMNRAKTIILLMVAVSAWSLSGMAAQRLVGGRGTVLAPELVKPQFSHAGRSPFLSVKDSEALGEAGSSTPAARTVPQESAGPLSDAEGQGAFVVQALLASDEGRNVTAIVSGQIVRAGKPFTLRIRGQAAEISVLEIDAAKSAVKFQYKAKSFIRAIPSVSGIH